MKIRRKLRVKVKKLKRKRLKKKVRAKVKMKINLMKQKYMKDLMKRDHQLKFLHKCMTTLITILKLQLKNLRKKLTK